MSTSVVSADGQVRRCGYTPCGQELRYDGRGRPPEYCADRRWPDGRTCKQLAAVERAGERAVGLEVPLETFRAAGDRFVPMAESLARQLLELVEAVGQVRDGALARVGESERTAGEAGETARVAENQRDQAQMSQRAAEAARDRAQDAAAQAAQRAADARREADERIAAAWATASEADHARGVAEAARAAHAAAATEWRQRADRAEEVAASAQQTAATRIAEATEAVGRAEAAQAEAQARAAELATRQEQLQTRIADLEAHLAGARTAAAVADHRAQTAEQDLRTARQTAPAEVAAAQARAVSAERRLDDVVAVLRAGPAAPGRLVDLNHVIVAGMVTYPGLPGPEITAHLTREDSRSHYAPGTEFAIDRISMVGNTGTYLDSPYHRYPEGADLADLPLSAVADLPVVVVRLTGAGYRGAEVADLPPASLVAGAAVLLHTGWDRHWGTDAYGHGAPYLTGAAAEWLAEHGTRLVGIDSVNIDGTDGGARPAHSVLLAAGVTVLEHLTGLGQLPDLGARLHAAPARVRGFGTFPVRAYALVPGAPAAR